MVRPRLLSAALVAAMAVPALIAPALAQDSDTATVVWVRSQLRGAIAPASTWTPLNADTRVKAGDTLKSGEDAAAELLFPTGARLTMGANTIVRLVDLNGLAPRVMTGRVHLYAPPQGTTQLAAGNFHLSGTDAEAVVERSNGAWRVGVLAGSFKLIDPSGRPSTVDAGKLVTFAAGGPKTTTLARTQLDDLQQGFDQGGNNPPIARNTPSPEESSAPTMARAGSNGANRWGAAGLSLLLPGAGQLYGGEVPRGLLYLGLEGVALGTGFYGHYFGQSALVQAAAGGLIGLNVIAPLDAYFTTREAPATPAP